MEHQEIVNWLLIAEKSMQWPELAPLHRHALEQLKKAGKAATPAQVVRAVPPRSFSAERPDGMPSPTPQGVTRHG